MGVVVTPTETVANAPPVPVIVIVALPAPCGVTTKTFGLEPCGATVATPALLVAAVNGPADDPLCVAVTVFAYAAPVFEKLSVVGLTLTELGAVDVEGVGLGVGVGLAVGVGVGLGVRVGVGVGVAPADGLPVGIGLAVGVGVGLGVVDPVPPDPLQAATAASTMATHTQPMGLSRNRNATSRARGKARAGAVPGICLSYGQVSASNMGGIPTFDARCNACRSRYGDEHQAIMKGRRSMNLPVFQRHHPGRTVEPRPITTGRAHSPRNA